MNVVDPPGDGLLVAYFCSEFGVDERLPIYAGGLGVLAGDHLKSSSDLEVPLVGVGLFYRGGYFRQSLDETGWQCEAYPDNDPESLGLERLPVEVLVDLAGEQVAAAVWRLDVGRVPLYLLDSDLSQNSSEGRAVTATLYGGDREQRIRQEILLGVGGVRALVALGVEATVFHMNEGHAALLALERVRRLVEDGVPRAEAFERVRSTTVFTTHTPVAAGHDVFDPELAERYLGPLAAGLRMSFGELAALGSENGGGSAFGMTPLALRTSAYVNGVSSLHGEVSRRMWKPLWPELGEDEVPIMHITNGVHPGTWLSPAIAELLPEGRFDRAREIDPEELWHRHAALKSELLEHVASASGIRLDPDALTVGFARRFATYKRADLLFADRERAARLLADPSRPAQIVLAGKAHPADDAGKELLRRIAEVVGSPEFAGRVVFLEGYDLALARVLVRGSDVWLNTPDRPLEASGTSGMKAGMNGVLNLSILDGWWAEGFSADYGWKIGNGTAASDHESLLATLEHEVVPRFYDERGVWVEMMKASIAEIGVRFSSDRMVREYVEKLYVPAARSSAAASSGATVFT